MTGSTTASRSRSSAFEVPLEDADPWRAHGCPMNIRRTRPDPTRDYARERAENGGRLRYPPTYANAESHWWDASQIYGSNHETTQRLRSAYRTVDGKTVPTGELLPDGKLYLNDDNLILDPNTHRSGQARNRAHRVLRQLVGRAEPAAHAVRPRAQRDLR